jgi:transcriptional regulator with GAF, ATPase, and Fis domain
MIHSLDPRPRKGELVVLDCTTIVPTLSGSEFFGHERGAFTGATAAREGAFGLANGGTLFLDEVGELPLPLQSELLRVVQEGVYKRVGANNWRTTSFRLICATNRDLFAEAAAGRFRYDLLYRLAGSILHLPSLNERREDILSLAEHFLSENADGDAPAFEQEVASFLIGRDYPGNVRELRQLMARIAYRHVGPGPITVGDVPPDEWGDGVAGPERGQPGFVDVVREAVARGLTLREIAAAASDVAVAVALDEENGSLKRAAARLGVTPRALQMRRANGRGLPPPRR